MELSNGFIVTVRTPPSTFFRRRLINSTVSVTCTSISESGHRTKLAKTLQTETLQTLEWPSVCKQVSAFTSTTMGFAAAQSGHLPLGRCPEESRKLLDQTAAAKALHLHLDFSGIGDISGVVDSSVSGELVTISELCAVKRTLKSARELFEQLQEVHLQHNDSPGRYLPLLEILQACNFLVELQQKIEYCIDCKFSKILDRASDDLEIIRSERKLNMENLDSLLKKISTQIFHGGGIDKPMVTKRRSRMCVGIKASHRSLLPKGIVLDVSSSGATLFIEPKEAVELNNSEVKLSNLEKVEEQAVLSVLTCEIAESRTEIKYLLDRFLELDLAFARASHANWIHGVCPKLTSEIDIPHRSGASSMLVDIQGIRHPLLLEASLTSSSNEGNGTIAYGNFPVPINIKVGCATRVVVISGPNTGGKTASMKTLGLASVMSKAGMYLPARNEPSLPWFDLILADIGDHQSLEKNLSTFSGHISKLCQILEVSSKESLVLIDEIGSGTDPSEGVALSTSILQYLKDRVNLAVVTTHYADLTYLKESDDRFENAAMEFSVETLQPTYQILWGSRGDSNALSIARSIGFDEEILQHAKTWVEKLNPENQQTRRSLLYQSLLEEKKKLEAEANRAASVHSDTMVIYNEIQSEAEGIESREEALMAKESQKVIKDVKAVRHKMEVIIQEFENKLRSASPDQFGSLIKKSESEIASIVEAHTPSDDFSDRETSEGSYTVRAGEQVLVKSLGNKLATVVEPPGEDNNVLVQYGKIRVRVSRNSVSALQSSEKAAPKRSVQRFQRQVQKREPRNTPAPSKEGEMTYGPAVQTSKNSVDLRGMRVEEASHALDIAINSRGSGSVLFVIHGMGTGVVKERVIEILKNHPRIVKFDQGEHIDLLSSDHSPSVPELKLFKEGNFLKAWGGISSLQFVLPVTWSYGRKYGMTLEKLASLWSEKPAKLAGLDLKGSIVAGKHADIVIWEPEVEYELNDSHPVFFKHRSISAYMGSKLSGKVLSTFVRGNLVYKEGKHASAACGVPILAR